MSFHLGTSDVPLPGDSPGGTVWYIRADNSYQVESLNGGIVYVMNDAGATVGKYDLGRYDERNQADTKRR